MQVVFGVFADKDAFDTGGIGTIGLRNALEIFVNAEQPGCNVLFAGGSDGAVCDRCIRVDAGAFNNAIAGG